jgi:hypothetical protein
MLLTLAIGPPLAAEQTMNRATLTMSAMLLAVAEMASGGTNSKPEILVRVFEASAVSGPILSMAEAVASEILASVGVYLRWANARSPDTQGPSRCGTSGSVQRVDLRFTYSTARDHKPRALAETFLFAQSGVHIIVFYDRLERTLALYPKSAGRILGHVLAHEASHVLLRFPGHAENGLMKAHWSQDDYSRMGFKNLGFTPEDATLIRSNLASACSPAATTGDSDRE